MVKGSPTCLIFGLSATISARFLGVSTITPAIKNSSAIVQTIALLQLTPCSKTYLYSTDSRESKREAESTKKPTYCSGARRSPTIKKAKRGTETFPSEKRAATTEVSVRRRLQK